MSVSVYKCLKCKKIVKTGAEEDEEFHFIFDESGVDLELQKLLHECFDIIVTKKRNDKQGLCSSCVENLVDTYDLIQKDVEDQLNDGGENIEISGYADSDLVERNEEDSSPHLVNDDNDTLVENFHIIEDLNDDGGEDVEDQNETTTEVYIYDEIKEVDGSENEEMAIEQIYDKSKQLEDYFVDDSIADDEFLDKDDINDEEDEKKVSLLGTMNEDKIDIFEYKKKIIKIDPTETNLKHSLFCVVSIFYLN